MTSRPTISQSGCLSVIPTPSKNAQAMGNPLAERHRPNAGQLLKRQENDDHGDLHA